MGNLTIEVLIVLLLIVANGLFALSEAAVVASRKARLQQYAQSGDSSAKIALELADDPSRFLSTVQIGITLIGIFAGAFGGEVNGTGAVEVQVDAGLAGIDEGLDHHFDVTAGEEVSGEIVDGNAAFLTHFIPDDEAGFDSVDAAIDDHADRDFAQAE